MKVSFQIAVGRERNSTAFVKTVSAEFSSDAVLKLGCACGMSVEARTNWGRYLHRPRKGLAGPSQA